MQVIDYQEPIFVILKLHGFFIILLNGFFSSHTFRTRLKPGVNEKISTKQFPFASQHQ
jgi:hypothetical protein